MKEIDRTIPQNIEEMVKAYRLFAFVGAYGSGKSENSIHFALEMKNRFPDKSVYVVDLDVVNPFYRSADGKAILNRNQIEIITPLYAKTNIDVPALSGEMFKIFDQKDCIGILDVGGDDVGAKVLGSLSRRFEVDALAMVMVVNCFRPLTQTCEQILEQAEKIEVASKQSVVGFINNSNLLQFSSLDELIQGDKILQQVRDKTNRPILFGASISPIVSKEHTIGNIEAVFGYPIFSIHSTILYNY